MKGFIKGVLLTSLFFTVLVSCEKKKETEWTYEISGVRHSFLASYQLASQEHLNRGQVLQTKMNAFCVLPIVSRFNTVRDAWASSWNAYQYIKPFWYMSSEIDNPIGFDVNRIETWNFDPSYIDATVASPSAGIIVNPTMYPVISHANVNSWHTSVNSTLGYQVLEFLLWGEDNSVSSGGNRTHQDFISTSTTNDRRRTFLKASSDNFAEGFTAYFNESFETEILIASNKEFMRFILSGLVDFLEEDFVGNTLRKPFLSQEPNDELSRYSENTIIDIQNKIGALELILNGNGQFTSEVGYFLLDFINDVDGSLKSSIEVSIAEMHSAVESIQGNFDTALSSSIEMQKIEALIMHAEALTLSLKEFAVQIKVEL